MIVGDVSRPASVYGVHGTTGLTYWSCLTRRAGLSGGWEAVEWASIPPGGVSGEHLHTRTEEVYFLLSGEGELVLDGRPHRVGPGDMALTRVGSRHGLRNVLDRPLNWLVIELTHPSTQDVLGGREPRKEPDSMPSRVVNLRDLGEIDAGEVFASALESVRITRLTAGRAATLVADGREHTLFVLAGDGVASSGEVTTPIAEGTSVTLPLGDRLTIEAGPSGVEFFAAALRVDEP